MPCAHVQEENALHILVDWPRAVALRIRDPAHRHCVAEAFNAQFLQCTHRFIPIDAQYVHDIVSVRMGFEAFELVPATLPPPERTTCCAAINHIECRITSDSVKRGVELAQDPIMVHELESDASG